MLAGLNTVQRLKLQILECGIDLTPAARDRLTHRGNRNFVEKDYVTTGGITLDLTGDVFVNAPVGEWFCDRAAAILDVSPRGEFELRSKMVEVRVEPLPLPEYLFRPEGKPQSVMTHADRIRLSPLDGCACTCHFCDWPLTPYNAAEKGMLLASLRIALEDQALPARHVLVSGGTPLPQDEAWLEDIYLGAIATSPLPVDVMAMPRRNTTMIDRLVEAGVHGFSVNLELYDSTVAAHLCPSKHRVGLDAYARTIRRAVELTGGRGRVRSLLLIGLEPPESSLAGVEFIASLGADPVLSPFRPAKGTELGQIRPPCADLMEDLYLAAQEISSRHGVKLGPRCIPCMHNTVTFPDDTGAYFYS